MFQKSTMKKKRKEKKRKGKYYVWKEIRKYNKKNTRNMFNCYLQSNYKDVRWIYISDSCRSNLTVSWLVTICNIQEFIFISLKQKQKFEITIDSVEKKSYMFLIKSSHSHWCIWYDLFQFKQDFNSKLDEEGEEKYEHYW